jgi:hypothetical protein
MAQLCTEPGYNCGVQSDGCGGTVSCGTCGAGTTCGGGGVSNVCGGGCTPTTCAALLASKGINCGPVDDGCGNILNCGTCTAPGVCGGGSSPMPNVCGTTVCTPQTCESLGYNCGSAPDGCGNTLECGSCSAPQACGGGGTPNTCGCTGTCSEIVTCTGGTTTSLTGYVYDPADLHPIYNVVVYIPNNPSDPNYTTPFSAGVTCDQCGAGGVQAAGDPLVVTSTDTNGMFTLTNVPVGSSIPLAIQSGRWRREFTVNVATACASNDVAGNATPVEWLSGTPQSTPADGHLTFPSSSAQGDIPRIAINSGSFDMVECELLKMGISPGEFSDPGAWGQGSHVQVYAADSPNAPFGYYDPYTSYPWGAGAVIDGNTPSQDQLFGTDATTGNLNIDQYDLVIMECEGYEQDQSTTQLTALANYANAGGRVFTSDFAYAWLDTNTTMANGVAGGVADWDVGQDPQGRSRTAVIDETSNPKAAAFQDWLSGSNVNVVGASGGTFTLNPVYMNSNGVGADTQQWLYWKNGGTEQPIHMTFDTPYGAASTCGRVVFSDWHTQDAVQSQSPDTGTSFTFPAECEQSATGNWTPWKPSGQSTMSDQETILEFMLFDLTACVTQYQASCIPATCTELGDTCGMQGDGCGNIINCGSCTGSDICTGSPSACTPPCTPATCASLMASSGINCGMQGDGCGGTLDCGTCTMAGQSCGGGGTPGQCGGLSCISKTCAEQGIGCGPAGDGCGNTIQCGSCPTGQTCGGGGSGVCGSGGSCTPATCTSLGDNCGAVGDGCGNLLQCGTCTGTNTCGGGGKANQCGSATCIPATCQSLGFNCGAAGDGCGNLLQCGTCPAGETCGANNMPNVCGTSSCTPQTCQSLGYNCGVAGDGCGGTLPSCGTCVAPDTCGGGGQANVCGDSMTH